MSVTSNLISIAIAFLTSSAWAAMTCEEYLGRIFYDQPKQEIPANMKLVPLDILVGPATPEMDLSFLAGKHLVGRIKTMPRAGLEPAADRFVKGVIQSARVFPSANPTGEIGPKFWAWGVPNIEITIAGSSPGESVPHVYWYNYSAYLRTDLFVLQSATSAEAELKEQINKDLLIRHFQWFFKGPVVAKDFDVAYAAALTYLTLPSNYGVTGTVATLRGKSPKTSQHKYYGLLADDKRYTNEGLINFVRALESLMTWFDLVSISNPNPDQYWLQHKETAHGAQMFLDALDGLREQPGRQLSVTTPLGPSKEDYKKAALAVVDFSRVSTASELIKDAVSMRWSEPYSARVTEHPCGKDLAVARKSKSQKDLVILYEIKAGAMTVTLEGQKTWAILTPFV